MAEPFLAEVRIVGFNFPPRGWAFCDGQILPINQNQSLYSLLGTTYGGDGRTSFALPDLRGRTPIHFGNGYNLGNKSGTETVSLSQAEMPAHGHTLQASSVDGTAQTPSGNVLARTVGLQYEAGASSIGSDIHADTIAAAGSSQGHNNMMPYITLAFCIALQGVFPSRN